MIQQNNRRLGKARKVEEENYKTKVSEEVYTRMEKLRAEGERLRPDLEGSLQSAIEKDQMRVNQAKQERVRAELE